MKIKQFILKDSVDDYYTDLIIFDHEVEFEDVCKAIQKVKNDKPEEYVCDDIFDALEKVCHFTYIWLGDLKELEY